MRLAGVLCSLLLLAAVLHPPKVAGLSCPDVCVKSRCERLKCAYGKIKDVCNCCDFCGNGPGEQCGGEFGILGMCGKGLECVSNEAFEPAAFPEGTCAWKKLPPGLKFQRPAKWTWKQHNRPH
ncbi:single insulin-like growth factor-binding domain protein-2 [Neocloeon triangulifer]|uniref:single insulin-like growth factor-binding domain protein-2 n=1 Tax=Neocloeon triangulifer TaxID=2078957 RepID=UPI00286EC062|nr:single insulin-like growth factor-binding domain protein-2 [Neocloeon triangulifer]